MTLDPVFPQMVTAGYVVAAATRRPEAFDPGVPDPFLTISECLADGRVVPEYSGWFQDLDEARGACRGGPAGSLLFVVGLTPQDADLLMREMRETWHESWHFELLRSGVAPPEDAEWRGFEIVGAEPGLNLHSWHCHSYAPDAGRDLGVRLNRDGLLSRYEDAVRVRRWMLDMPPDDQPAPVPWAVVGIGILSC